MTRTGKIARLPRAVREELNQRLLDGETGPRLVAWLNEQAEVQAVLAEHFAGKAIRVQNISEWRAGGWGDWCRQRQVLELAALLGEECDEFDKLAEGGRLADRCAQAAAVVIMGEIRAVRAMEAGPDRMRAALRVVAGLVRLRGSERQWERSMREGELHEREVHVRELAERELKEGEREVDGINLTGTTAAEKAMKATAKSDRVAPNPGKSDQIRPAGKPVGAVEAVERIKEVEADGAVVGALAAARTAEVNPTKSGQIRPLEIQVAGGGSSEGGEPESGLIEKHLAGRRAEGGS